MEELLESIEKRGLLVNIIYRESRDIKKHSKGDLESAIENTLLRYGWSERDVNFVTNIDNESEDIEAMILKSREDLLAHREVLRQARAEELASIKNLISTYFPEDLPRKGEGKIYCDATRLTENSALFVTEFVP